MHRFLTVHLLFALASITQHAQAAVDSHVINPELFDSEVVKSAIEKGREWNELISPEFHVLAGKIKAAQSDPWVGASSLLDLNDRLEQHTVAVNLDNLERVQGSMDTQFPEVAEERDSLPSSGMVLADAAMALSRANGESIVLTQSHSENASAVSSQTSGIVRDPESEMNIHSSVSIHPQETSPEISESLSQDDGAENIQPTYVEAFAPNSIFITDAHNKILSLEATSKASPQGWRIAYDLNGNPDQVSDSSFSNYYPTISWFDPNQTENASLPMVSKNAITYFAKLAKLQPLSTTGIVVGKVAAGWDVQLSETTGRPLRLNSRLQPIEGLAGQEGSDSENYFVFFNVGPGAHLIYLSQAGIGGGAVALPVLAGRATYMSLTQISVDKILSGQVVDASSLDGVHPIKNALVRVIGKDTENGLTESRFSQADGSFSFDHILTVSSYPFFIETDKGRGFTHRYRVLPNETENLRLSRLHSSEIHYLGSQFNIDIRQDGPGLVVGNVPGATSRFSNLSLTPVLKLLLPKPNFEPATFTQSSSGFLTSNESRFIAVQTPDGPFVMGVEDSSGTQVWSELLYGSTGVVNVVGHWETQ